MSFVSEGDALTGREMDMLLALADGQGNSEIAAELGLSTETIRSYMKPLLVKLGAKNRTHAVALAYHRGLLVPEQALRTSA